MQRTIEEHRASPFANVSCATCHMPALPNGARGHGFRVASDPMMLKRAVVARASRDGDHVVVDLRPGEVGHAFPTGDLFRRLLVVAEVTGDDYELIAHAERPLTRHFRREARVQREIGDDRVQQPQRVDLVLGPEAREHPIAWRVEWQRVQSMKGRESASSSQRTLV